MKQASVRQLQHHLSGVIRWVDHGEEVKITRRNRVIARIVPDRPLPKALLWPNFVQRAHGIFKHPKGKPLSEIILEDREGRS